MYGYFFTFHNWCDITILVVALLQKYIQNFNMDDGIHSFSRACVGGVATELY